jgi:site-specific DNA recombinase
MAKNNQSAGEVTQKLAVIYARVSSREQEEEGYSIDAQLKALRKYAEKNGLTVIGEYVDIQTATQQGRKEFERMVLELKRLKTCRTLLVEKMDRLSRNDEDFVLLKKMDLEIHFVKQGSVYSKEAKAQTKFMQNIELATAVYYTDNLREEVIKGMREKAEQGSYPGHAPFGYRNNRELRNIEPHPVNAAIVKRAYELYATSGYTLSTLGKKLREEFGKSPSRARLHDILRNTAYIGFFRWREVTYHGNYEPIISSQLFDAVQAVFANKNRPKYRTVDIPFRGIANCGHCGCAMTGERIKKKHVYYRCTGFKGKCSTPRFRQQDFSTIFGEVLRNIQLPQEVVSKLMDSLTEDQERIGAEAAERKRRLERELAVAHERIDQTYNDKLDGKIPEEFWNRQWAKLQAEEKRLQTAIDQCREPSAENMLTVARTFELAQKAHSLYLTQDPTEQAKLLRLVLLNCKVDELNIYPEYKMPFNLIAERAKNQDWSGREDLNLRPPGPEPGALPG